MALPRRLAPALFLPLLCGLALSSVARSASADESPRFEARQSGAGSARGPRVVEDPEDAHSPTVFARDGWPLAGYHGGRFYLRDEHGRFQFFPGALLQIDGRGAFGKGVSDLGGVGGESLQPQVTIRRARVILGGTIHERLSWVIMGDLGEKSRLGSVLMDANISRYFRVTLGLQPVPLTMESRTGIGFIPWMERTLTSRFALPDRLDPGVLFWGEGRRRIFTYEVGASSGDGRERPESDGRLDYAARVTVRPLALTGSIASNIHLGFSGRFGVHRSLRNTADVGVLSTDGGWTFFSPTRTDADGRSVRILTSGQQRTLAGEVRIPVSRLDLRFEVVALSKQTREATTGSETASSERFGTYSGSSFYGQLGFWILGSPALGQPQPGNFRPPSPLRFPKGDRHRAPSGLEALARVESLSVTYRSNDRERRGDEAPREEKIRATVVGAGLRYWATAHASLFLSYTATYFPEAGTARNSAISPGNVAGYPSATTLHEVGLRTQLAF
jgi:hypothetical protein